MRGRSWLSWTSLLCVAWATPLLAQSPDAAGSTAQTHLERGHHMMEELEFLNAVHEYSLVLTDDDATDEQQQEARLHAGMAHRYMENDVEARMLFLAALKREPTAQLPPGNHPPKLVTFFELVREEAVPAPQSATTSPPAATSTASQSDTGEGGTATVLNWGALTGSAALVVAGFMLLAVGGGIDGLLYLNPIAGSGDAKLDAIDFAGPTIGVVGVGVAACALALIPWWTTGAPQAEGAR